MKPAPVVLGLLATASLAVAIYLLRANSSGFGDLYQNFLPTDTQEFTRHIRAISEGEIGSRPIDRAMRLDSYFIGSALLFYVSLSALALARTTPGTPLQFIPWAGLMLGLAYSFTDFAENNRVLAASVNPNPCPASLLWLEWLKVLLFSLANLAALVEFIVVLRSFLSNHFPTR